MNQYADMRNGWTEKAIKLFWHRMGEIFGKPWYEHNGPEANMTWQASLVGLALDQVAATLNHYRKSGDAFPPNLSQFMAAAKQFRPQPAHVALPTPKPSEETVDRHVRDMAAALKVGGRRKVLLPGESFGDYQDAMNKAHAGGQRREEFDRERLRRNGWTDADEATFRRNAAGCGVRAL